MERDARRLPQAAQEELRRRAVHLVSQGRSQIEVAAIFGVRRQAVGRWIKAHREGGDRALAAARRGRRGGHTKLTRAHQEKIARLVAGKNPDQLSLPGLLWTRALVCELIERTFAVRVSQETAGRYLRAWGFSPQKPLRRAFEQSSEAVRAWIEQRYPEIERRAYQQGAEILWADEMGLRSDHQSGASWAPVGRTPVVKGTGQRFRTNMIAAVGNTGTLRFRVFQERFTGPVFLDFLKRLCHQAEGKKIVLIVDGHPAHRARIVRDWVAAHPELIELHYLPGYSPELNPAEMLNNDVKANALGRQRPRNLTHMLGSLRGYLRSRQRQPRLVARYFHERHVTYAAGPLFTATG
jgi:transposase